ncbi:MAG: acyl-CoA thioesterase [Candidatus Marinimicrobia bacterium]|nr:acyl-CoA thioesterase [Candidatus Neomarinimicrobiota bacterium]
MEEFNFTIPYTVRIADVNYGGHVANSAVLNFFQDARIAYLKNLGDYSELDIGNQCGVIMPEAHLKYLAEMFHDDELVIGVRIGKLGRSSFTMIYQIERDGETTAEGETVLVCFDYDKRKPRRLHVEFRERVEVFEGSRNMVAQSSP